jgi:HlyD family secretion protein
VKQAEQTLWQRQLDVDELTVTSPASGIVASVTVYQNDQPAAQSTLATVVDLTTLSFTAAIPQESAGSIHVGDPVTFYVNSYAYFGKVSTIGPSFSGTNLVTFPVTISLNENSADNGLRPGMTGTYHFPSGPSGSGTVSARTYTVRSRTAATVSSVAVGVGDKVTAGQTLMTMTSDSATLALQQAEVDLDNARQALNDLVTPDAATVASEEAKLAQTRTAYESAQADVDELTVIAPFDGVVTACNIDAGGRLAANSASAAFVVADFSKMSVNISVDELDVAKLKVGMEATVDVQAKPGQTYKAVVSSISPQGTVSQGVATYPVELQLTDPKDLLAGMTANVAIICDRRDDVLFVPVEAVQTVRGRSVVRVLDASGKSSSVEVQTGLSNDLYTEIVSGLSEGQTVVTGTVNANSSNGMRLGGMGVGTPAVGAPAGQRDQSQNPSGGK